MSNERTGTVRHMALFLLANLAAAWLLPALSPILGAPWDALLALLAGAAVLTLVDRHYGRALAFSVHFFVYLAWQIAVSSASIAWLVLQPHPRLDPGIIAVPLTVKTGLQITVLASAITLTPGTLSLDLGRDPTGHRVLYVHALRVRDPEQFRRSIQQGFERMILRIGREVEA